MSQDANRNDNPIGNPEAQTSPLLNQAELSAYVVEHIDEAVEKGWVVPYYQPVIRTLTGKLCGAEALARWEDPTYGLLSPAMFIGALEDARLIHKLDCSIIQQVCRHHRRMADKGNPLVPISFNLSRLDFDLCDIFGVVEEAARRYEVPRGMLNIEITETIMGTDSAFMSDMMGKFHAVGYQVWMDDFGSGYSTLNVLKDFDFDELKIDMEFLNRFGEKSKTILASVVDMAKKLGIQTLAEGVETEEQRDYLRSIGCEKMQGYLFGRPMPYTSEVNNDLVERIGVEAPAERVYFREIGGINTLSMSERDLIAGTSSQGYVTSMPLAIIEYENHTFRFIDSNRAFREALENMGVPSVEIAEGLINDTHRFFARQAQRIMDTIARDKYARLDFVVGESTCVIRAKHITTRNGKIALLISVDDAIEQLERKRHDRMTDALSILYSIYEHIDIIHLDENYFELVFDNAGFNVPEQKLSIDEIISSFATVEIFPSDQARYLAFMEPSTIVKRIKEAGEHYITDFFRIRQKGGDYSWRIFGLIHLDDQPGDQVLLCIRSTHWANDGLLQHAYDGQSERILSDGLEADLSVTDGSLWRALSRDDSIAFFWKDRDRRFIGANQAFLNYYDFESIDTILGKNDEDMGWHIDPTPFKEDELRVLNEGARIHDVVGQCIVRGEVRDILATKRPVYRNGRIVGLVGYFFDAAQRSSTDNKVESLPFRDSVTGVLNFTGLESATWKFVDTYTRQGIDFAMISVNLENFRKINEAYGYEFGDKVLTKVAEVLRSVAGHRCAIGHVFSERFVVLAQDLPDEELQQMCDDIEHEISSIAEIDGTQLTVFALASYARYSDHRDVEAMKRANRDTRLARQDKRPSDANESDVITSTLL